MNMIFHVSSQIQGNHSDYRSKETNQRMNLISTWFTFIKVLLERQHIFELDPALPMDEIDDRKCNR